MNTDVERWLPVRKIMAVFVGVALFWAARRLGVDLGDSEVNEAATAAAGLLLGYLVPSK